MRNNKRGTEENKEERLVEHPRNPNFEEAQYLFLKIIEQAIRDYINLAGATRPADSFNYHTAVGFLFDDDYLISYGGKDLSLEQILAILEIDIDWFRRKIGGLRMKTDRISDDQELNIRKL